MSSLIRAAKLEKTQHLLGGLASDKEVRKVLNNYPPTAETLEHVANLRSEPVTQPETTTAVIQAANPSHDVHVPPVQARVSIEELRNHFAEELDALRQEASRQGYTEGQESAQTEFDAKYKETLRRLERTEFQLSEALHQEISGLTEIGAEIVFEAVVKIIGRSYIDRAGVIDVVREVARQAKDRSRLLIRVNPAELAALVEAQQLLVESLNAQHLEFVSDDRVELGGCLLETPSGNLDGRLEIQFQQLRDTLLGARYRLTESVIEP